MDFSEVGINALRYALELFPDASYSVLHVRSNILDMSEPFPIKEQKLPRDIGIFSEQDWRDAMYKYIKQNPLCILGIAEIGPAVIGHEGSTIIVVLNTLRLLSFKD